MSEVKHTSLGQSDKKKKKSDKNWSWGQQDNSITSSSWRNERCNNRLKIFQTRVAWEVQAADRTESHRWRHLVLVWRACCLLLEQILESHKNLIILNFSTQVAESHSWSMSEPVRAGSLHGRSTRAAGAWKGGRNRQNVLEPFVGRMTG